MSYLVLAETLENPRGRFVADSFDAATTELGRFFPLGATVIERLRKGEMVVTDSYRLRVVPYEAQPPKRQQSLFRRAADENIPV